MAKPKNTEPMVNCGCYQTVSEPDGDCAACPKCGEIADVIRVCADGCGDDDGNSCECEANAEHERMTAEMKAEYDAEKAAKPEVEKCESCDAEMFEGHCTECDYGHDDCDPRGCEDCFERLITASDFTDYYD